jgi:putative ABC transport system permease protein
MPLLSDLRVSARSLVRYPAHTIVVTATLALGLGTATGLLMSFFPTLVPGWTFRAPRELVRIELVSPDSPHPSPVYGRFRDAFRSAESFLEVAEVVTSLVNIAQGEEVRGDVGVTVSPNFFAVLGVQPAEGRSFLPDENRPGADRVAIVTHEFARGLRGEGPVLGRDLRINGEPHRVVGILPQNWRPVLTLPNGPVYLPLVVSDADKAPGFWTMMVARLRPGVTLAQAEEELRRRSLPPLAAAEKWLENFRPRVAPLFDRPTDPWLRRYQTMLWTGVGAIGCLHLLACVNAGSLMLLRLLGRRRDIGIRLALGGSRWRVMRPFLVEGALLTLLAVMGALGVARWIAPALLAWLTDQPLDRVLEQGLQIEAQWFLVGLAAATGLATVALPLWRVTSLEANEIVKEGAHAVGEAPRLRRVRGTLVVVEAALAVVLLTGTGLLVRSFQAAQAVDVGFAADQRFMVRLYHTNPRSVKADEWFSRYERAAESMRTLPGVRDAALTSTVLGRGASGGRKFKFSSGAGSFETDQDTSACAVSPHFLELMEVPLLAGRSLGTVRRGDSPAVVVNASFARKYFPGRDPIGAHFEYSAKTRWEIIGVVGDTRSVREEARPRFYFPFWQRGVATPSEILVVTRGAPEPGFEKKWRRAIYEAEPGFAVIMVSPVQRLLMQEMAFERTCAALLKLLSSFALALTVVGVFATMAFATQERRGEFAVRLTLGAAPGDIARLVLTRGVGLAAAGVVGGVVLAAFASRAMETLLFGVQPLDPVTYGIVGLTMLLVAAPACLWPAWRAARIDPAQVLRDR